MTLKSIQMIVCAAKLFMDDMNNIQNKKFFMVKYSVGMDASNYRPEKLINSLAKKKLWQE